MIAARYSVLTVDCGLTIDEVLDLSPRQINDVYFHDRDERGAPEVSAPAPATQGGGRLAALLGLIESGVVKATAEQKAELRRRLDERK